MKFGVFNFGAWHESETQEQVLHHIVEEAVAADRLGYDTYWLGEHHFSRHGILADPMVLASHIAAKTERVRIGTAVVVLPLHHPVRLAEQIAMVDVLSNGRIDVGVGSGYQRREYNGLNVPMEESRERFREWIDILIKAWTSDTLIHDGPHYRLTAEDDIQIFPKPVQRPHPPIYQAISTTPSSVEYAASRGIPIMVGGPTDVLGAAPQVIDLWRVKMREHGNDPTGYDIPCAKGIYVAPTDEEAESDMRSIDRQWDAKILQQIGSPLSPAGELPPGYEAWENRMEQREQNRERRSSAGMPRLVGSPETVAARVRQFRDELGVTNIFGQFGIPGLPHDKVMRSIELFGSRVLPQFKDTTEALNPMRVRL